MSTLNAACIFLHANPAVHEGRSPETEQTIFSSALGQDVNSNALRRMELRSHEPRVIS